MSKSSSLSLVDLKSGEKIGTHVTRSAVIGYKKVLCRDKDKLTTVIAKIEIPAGSTIIRPSTMIHRDDGGIEYSPSKKLRTNKLLVRDFYSMSGEPILDECSYFSIQTHDFAYTKDKLLVPDKFDSDEEEECTNGLHFFLDEKMAQTYVL